MRGPGYGWAALAAGVLLYGCHAKLLRPSVVSTSPDGIRFTRITEQAGVSFRHVNGESGRKWFPEWLGGGCALFDFDGDGWLDLFLVNGGPLPGWKGAEVPRDRLYRNNRDGTFTDVTDRAGIRNRHYGLGCCVGDYDNDGHLDLFVTSFGHCILYRNRGNGTFADVTGQAGIGVSGLCSACAFGDYDGDGDLDLYVGRYAKYDLAHNVACYTDRGSRRVLSLCRPPAYRPEADVLYHNNGNGTFAPATAAALVPPEPGRGMGVLFADLAGRGSPDIFVSNDLTPNFLLQRDARGPFRDRALEKGVAFDLSGKAQAGMGIACADVDGDGLPDLVVTHFSGEYATLYRQLPGHTFHDDSAQSGLVEATAPYVGFGVGLEDLDLDGWPDLLIANGALSNPSAEHEDYAALSQPKLVLRNDGGRRFVPVPSPWSNAETAQVGVGRGTAFGDFDNDGDVDVVVSNLNGPADLLRNDTVRRGHWLQLRLRSPGKNRFAVGARVSLFAGGHRQVQFVHSGGSYFSQSDFRLTFGLGSATAAERVEILWPDRRTEQLVSVPADQCLLITERQQTRGERSSSLSP